MKDNRPQLLLPAALVLQRLGLSVIPMRFGSKKPAVRWKRFQEVRADEDTIRSWFADTDNSQLGIGVVAGEVSGGLLVRDFDVQASYEAWKRANPVLAAELPTLLASRGPHVWFRSRGYKKATHRTFVRDLGDGELRGDGHIVVVPPTIHPKSGQPYRWLIEPTDPIPLVDLHTFGFPSRADVTQDISVLHLPAAAASAHAWASGSIGAIGSSPPTSLHHHPHPSVQPSGPPARVEDAIARTLPQKVGQRHKRIFEFARCLKAIPSVAGLEIAKLEPLVRQWHTQALPVVGTKHFAETWQDFQQAWDRVRLPAGSGSLAAAWQRAVASPLPPEAEQFKSPQIRLLVSLCRELQRERGGDDWFYLSCRDAAAALGLHGSRPHVAAWRWLRMLCHVGILKRGAIGSQRDRKANEYRYLPASGVDR